jgi:hypothetical protein
MSMNNVACSLSALGRHADALKLYEQTLELQMAKLDPDHGDTIWSLWGTAHTLAQLDRGAEALPVIDECIRRAANPIVSPRFLQSAMDLRLRHFQTTQDAAGCRETAEMWENMKRTDAASLYRAARMRAVTAAVLRAVDESATSNQTADAEADRAMAWLTQAIASGFKKAAHMLRDKDLDAVRDRADFAKLVMTLEGIRD